MMLFALIFIGIAVVITLAAGWLASKSRPSKIDPEMYAVLVALHRIRRRLDVFLFKVEVQHRAKYAERQLSKELRDLRQRERGGRL